MREWRPESLWNVNGSSSRDVMTTIFGTHLLSIDSERAVTLSPHPNDNFIPLAPCLYVIYSSTGKIHGTILKLFDL